MKLNPNDAPEGYVAKLDESHIGCKGCWFDSKGYCYPFWCPAVGRADKCDVIFVKKSKRTKNQVSHG